MAARSQSTDFHAAMKEASVSALWEREMRSDEPNEPPHIWRWKTMAPLIDAAVAETGMDAAERRVLCLDNPALTAMGRRAAATNLSVNLQVLMPGERARPHRHTMNALRFVIDGEGAATVVDGKHCPMAPGDMILTPGWTWHEHVHEGKERIVWVDALDVPLHEYLDSSVFEPGPAYDLPEVPPDPAFGAPGVVPATDETPTPYSPLFRYGWETVAPALAAAPRAADGSRTLRYVNPVTGEPAMPTLDCYMLGLDKGRRTRRRKSNGNAVLVVLDGEGVSEIGDTTFEWSAKDIFSVPHGHWASHQATSAEARLFVITDREILRRLELLREEAGN